jgi:hypothetical protein
MARWLYDCQVTAEYIPIAPVTVTHGRGHDLIPTQNVESPLVILLGWAHASVRTV